MTEICKTKGVYTIAVASNILGVNPRTLRLYEKAGFIQPSRDPVNNYRLYSNEDINHIRCIRGLLKNGLNINGLKTLLALIPCWKVKECQKKCAECNNSEEFCWSTIQSKNANKFEEYCKNCTVYRSTKDQQKIIKKRLEQIQEAINY